MAFLETPRFPTDISYGSAGGPTYQTQVVRTKAGHEYRNRDWSYPLHTYDVAWGIKEWDDLEELLQWFHARGGREDGFRFKDHLDWKSCPPRDTAADTDQTLGTGDASETDFQLIKTYTRGAVTGTRQITKPVTGSVVVSLDDVPQASGWSVDTTTGVVTFVSPPGGGVVVKAGYEFDVPVRFDIDELEHSLENYHAGRARVPLVELRNP